MQVFVRQYPGCVVAYPPQGTANSPTACARLIAVTTRTEMAGRPSVLRGTGTVDPNLEANTLRAAVGSVRTSKDFDNCRYIFG
jgi:hypothetical protein